MSQHSTHVLELVDDYLHDVLPRTQADHVQQHCEECPICRVALDEARKRFEMLRAEPIHETSEELISRTLQYFVVQDQRRGRTHRWVIRGGFIALAACAATAATAHIYYATLRPSPYDLRVLGQKELLAGTPSSLRIQMFDRNRELPLAGVPVDVELVDMKGGAEFRLASFTTDDQGTGSPRFELPDWKNGSYQLRVTAQPHGAAAEHILRTVQLKRSWRLMLSTDKPVYQPGQTIHLRGLALRQPDLKPVAGEEAVFTIADPRGTIVFKHRDATSRYGITAADCPLATEILEGAYTIACRIGDTESKTTVEVKHYLLPKFKITIDLEQPYYQPGQRVSGTVNANYFFGQPVAGATVLLKATLGRGPTLPSIPLHTDEKGTARFNLRLPDNAGPTTGESQFKLVATATDTAGQKQEGTTSRPISRELVRIEVIPEAGELVRGLPNTIYLFTTYPDGQPAACGVSIVGQRQEVQTDATGVGSFEITPGADEVQLVMRARDAAGHSASRQVALSAKSSGQFILRTDRAVYRGGETMRLSAIASGVEPIFVDLLRDGQTLLTTTLPVKDARADAAVDLPPELFGTLELRAYRLGSSGLPQRKTRVIYVSSARDVRVEVQMDHKEYRPGRQVQMQIRLTDSHGKPVPGAVSLGAVDEAVYSVLGAAPGLERTFFTLNEELLKPVYAIYPWSPDLRTRIPLERKRRLEQALFARTAEQSSENVDRLQKMVEEGRISPRELEVLEYENLDGLLEQGWVSPELRALIVGEGKRDLVIGSYAPKSRATQARSNEAIRTLQSIWWLLGIGSGVWIIVLLTLRFGTTLIAVLIALMTGFLLISILLPSLSRAREMSPRAMAAASLKSIEFSMELAVADLRADLRSSTDLKAVQSGVRIREWFPETLLWRPEVITDDQGIANLPIELADSITTWRVTGSAVTADGGLGTISSAIRVFQPFFVDLNLPVYLTRGDEIAVPAVVYNCLDRPQRVELTLDAGDWFQALDGASSSRSGDTSPTSAPASTTTLELAPNQVLSTSFRIRALKVGKQTLTVTARGEGVADAIKRVVDVVPDGRPIEQVYNGTVTASTPIALDIPEQIIPGSVTAILKLYPSTFSQLVEGLDAIFQRPYGCFEQTSSTTYPNVLALDYLRSTGKSMPAVEAKAREYIHLGYQRLLSFEIPTGGFDWFGRPPANRTLTAYGLMEFEDMARVHDVDSALIERTRRWLLSSRRSDGSWQAEEHGMHEDPTQGRGDRADADYRTTAYIAWAVYRGQLAPDAVMTRKYLLARSASDLSDPYVLALTCHALRTCGASDSELQPYRERLLSLRKTGEHDLTWWEQAAGRFTTFYGAGRTGHIEATSAAVLSQLDRPEYAQVVRGALSWLVQQKDGAGTWGSTQATVLTLKALLDGSTQPIGGNQERDIHVAVDQQPTLSMKIPADQAEVMKQIDLSSQLAPGRHDIVLHDSRATSCLYQFSVRYHLPGTAAEPTNEPLRIALTCDREQLQAGQSLTMTAVVTNQMNVAAPMVLLDLPIPPGFAVDSEDWSALMANETISKYQMTPRSVIVYLRDLEGRQRTALSYRLRAVAPGSVTLAPAEAYRYYQPEIRARAKSLRIRVVPDI